MPPPSHPTPPIPAPADDWPHTVLATQVLPDVVRGAEPQQRPVVVFVAGQPGSGKTLVADLVQAALNRRGGAVRVDHDEYKAAHPSYRGFLDDDVRTAGVRVRPETYWWQAEVEAHVRASRYDAVVETPLADPEAFRRSATAYRQAGYQVEVIAMAVPEAVSQLGVLDRYLRLAEAGRPRYVAWQNHDRCAAGLIASLQVCEAEHLADRVLVIGRTAEVGPALYDNVLTSAGCWLRPAGAGQAVVTERARPWGAQETGRFRSRLAQADRRAHRTAPEDWGLAVQRDAERAAALAEPVRRIAQPRAQPPGVDYHRLSAEEHQWIYDKLIAPPLLKRIVPQERPVAVFVMGQPGAGKTRTAKVVRQALREGTVRIDRDRFLVAHPDYRQLLREEPHTAEVRLAADCRSWQARAEAQVREQRGDVVIETAPVGVGEFLADADLYRRAGYRVELAVLAVRATDSRQGGAARYADASRHGARPARLTPAHRHDAHFAVLAEVVAAAEQSEMVDSVAVMRQDGDAVHRHERTDGRRPHAAVRALVTEQLRPYTTEEAARFLATQRRLRAAMPQHRDELAAISRLARPLMPLRLQPWPLPQPAAPAALPARYGWAGRYDLVDSNRSSRAS